MQRRAFLIGAGATVALAGCAGDNEDPEVSGDSDTNTEEDEQSTEPTENDTETESKTETETPEPADLSISNLSVEQSTVDAGESVRVSVEVKNNGGKSGERTIPLFIDGEEAESRDVELKPGEQSSVEFDLKIDDPGRYDVSVGTEQSTLEVVTEPELTVQTQELGVVDAWFNSGRAYAEAIIENTGDARCGTIEIVARWFDDSGTFIGEDSKFLPSLDTGETWIARIGTSRDIEDIDEFELSGEYEITAGNPPDGMSIADSTFNIEEPYRGRITAEINNTRDESLFMASFEGILYNDNGEVIAGNQTREADISPREDLFFELPFNHISTLHRIDKATDYEVFLIESESFETRQFG